MNGTAIGTGYLSRTDDHSLLTFTGAVTTNTSVFSNANTFNPRNVGTRLPWSAGEPRCFSPPGWER
jgi:hypothetical protein